MYVEMYKLSELNELLLASTSAIDHFAHQTAAFWSASSFMPSSGTMGL